MHMEGIGRPGEDAGVVRIGVAAQVVDHQRVVHDRVPEGPGPKP